MNGGIFERGNAVALNKVEGDQLCGDGNTSGEDLFGVPNYGYDFLFRKSKKPAVLLTNYEAIELAKQHLVASNSVECHRPFPLLKDGRDREVHFEDPRSVRAKSF